jgi:hypothetical protein
MLASQKLANTLGEVVIRPELDGLKTEVPLDTRANVTNEPRGDLIRWFWKGLLYTDDKLSVRVSLGCQGEAVVRAKVRAYYDKAFASVASEPPGERDHQEIYTGKTRKFAVDADSEANFSSWLKNELHKCTAALQRHT